MKLKRLVINVLFAAYQVTDWVRGRILSALIKLGLPESKAVLPESKRKLS